MRTIWWEAARPKTLPAAGAPVVLATALAVYRDSVNVLAALICLVFALLVQIGANFANDYYDGLKGADRPGRTGPVRATAAGLVKPSEMWQATLLVFGSAFLVGMLLVIWGGWWLVLVGVLCILAGLAYTGGPYPLGYHGLGDVFVFVFFGLVAVGGCYYVQTGHLSFESLLVGAVPGLLAANLLAVNNYRDAPQDAGVGKRTLAVRYGLDFVRRQYAYSLLGSFLIVLLWALFTGKSGALLPLLLLPWAWLLMIRLVRTPPGRACNDLLAASGKFLLCFCLLWSLGMIW